MPATATIPRPIEIARARMQRRERQRCAEAMAVVADGLQAEWQESGAADAALWKAAVLARSMQRELEGTAKAGSVQVNGPELNVVLARFADEVRAIPALTPDACFQCDGLGFVHVTGDQGEVCELCGGSGVIRC